MIDLDDPKGHTVETLHAEIRRLRSLPVLTTCGDCRWNDDGRCGLERGAVEVPPSERDRLGYALVPYDDRTGDYLAPPSWCPLREEGRRLRAGECGPGVHLQSQQLAADRAVSNLSDELTALRAAHATVSAELVGLRLAAESVYSGPEGCITDPPCGACAWCRLGAALASSAPIGARIIAEAEERVVERVGEAIEAAIVSNGREVPDGSGCDSGDPADFIAAQVNLLCVGYENEAADLLARAEKAEEHRDEVWRELDTLEADVDEHLPEYVLGDGTGETANARERIEYAGDEIKRLTRERDEAIDRCNERLCRAMDAEDALAPVTAERDALAAKLAEVERACERIPAMLAGYPVPVAGERAAAALRSALASAPSASLARVRAGVCNEVADDAEELARTVEGSALAAVDDGDDPAYWRGGGAALRRFATRLRERARKEGGQ